jgi:hypothetical protein
VPSAGVKVGRAEAVEKNLFRELSIESYILSVSVYMKVFVEPTV